MDESPKFGSWSILSLVAFVALFAVGSAHSVQSTQTAASANANAALHLDFGPQLSSATCNGTGKPFVSVTQGITNDADSGEAGNYWAFDTFQRKIQVWQTNTAGTYCAVISYQGNFSGVSGQRSPGNTGVLNGSERGPIQGGYAATIVGTPLASPAWTTNGNVGTTDYQCDIQGNCPGAISWVDQYFNSGSSFTYNWWGWIYRAGGNKVWVNASAGNQGDVI